MKTLSINPGVFQLDITDPKFITLIIESKPFYWRFSKYLYDTFPDHLNYCSLLKNGEQQKIEDFSTYIYNPLDLSLNTKQNLNSLYKILKKSYFSELTASVQQIQESLTQVCKEIRLDFDAELTMESSIRIDDVFKIGGLQFSESDSSLLERFVRYISVIKELQNISIIFINHLHDFFENSEIEKLLKETEYRGITIVNIETNLPRKKLENEIVSIIDRDLCSINSI